MRGFTTDYPPTIFDRKLDGLSRRVRGRERNYAVLLHMNKHHSTCASRIKRDQIVVKDDKKAYAYLRSDFMRPVKCQGVNEGTSPVSARTLLINMTLPVVTLYAENSLRKQSKLLTSTCHRPYHLEMATGSE